VVRTVNRRLKANCGFEHDLGQLAEGEVRGDHEDRTRPIVHKGTQLIKPRMLDFVMSKNRSFF
jgi:hypothetical protein